MLAAALQATQPVLCKTPRMTTAAIQSAHVAKCSTVNNNMAQSCIDTAATQHAVAIPPTPLSTKLGARVEHITPTQPGLLSTVLAQHLPLPPEFFHALLRFGAIYHCPVHPLPPSCLPAADAERIHALRKAGMEALGRPCAHQDQVPLRLDADCHVEPWSYLRVHLHPKRFPMAYGVDWKSRVILQNDAFVVIDKPPGVSVVPRVDNQLECCLRLTADALGMAAPLLSTHRLDTYTQGVLVMATQPQHVTWFNTQLQGGRTTSPTTPAEEDNARPLTKVYRALTATPPALGMWRHAAWANVRVQGLPAFTIMLPLEHLEKDELYGKKGALAQLHVLDVQQVSMTTGLPSSTVRIMLLGINGQVALTGSAADRWGPVAYESTIRLITGRTHQIRAQLAAEGHPLLGDPLYSGLQALHAARGVSTEGPEAITEALREMQAAFQRPRARQQPPSGSPRALQDAEDAMGLQAWQLHVRVEGGSLGGRVLEAGLPWWRA